MTEESEQFGAEPSLFPLRARAATSMRKGKILVGPVDIEITGTGTTVVIGPNGAGKTSLLRMLHGLARLSSGELSWGCPVEAARRQQSFVFQRPVMLRRSVEDNLIYPLRLRGVPRAEARKRAHDWAERVGLAALLDQQAPALSGGEQQKLALARALITGPRLVFLDEPTASLDGRATREFEDILTSATARGTCFILATHDMGQARRLAHQVVFMLHGKIHDQAERDRFFAGELSPEAKAFLRGDIVE